MINQLMDKNIELYWSGPSWTIPGTSWDIVGYSRASYRTGFYIKSLNLLIDAGPHKNGNPKTILITHCHGDHIASIPFTLIDGSKNPEKPNIFVPREAKERLHNYINAMFSANYCQDFNESIVNYYPVKGGDVIVDYIANNTKIKIEIFKCIHDVPTVAYGISTRKEHLKKEFFDLKGNGKALSELKKQGVEITEITYVPNIVFVWDTTIDILCLCPKILTYSTVMIECTFLFDDDYEQSLAKKHIHWKSLKPYILEYPHINFVLIHFSLRYSELEIAAFFKSENLINVKPWLQLK